VTELIRPQIEADERARLAPCACHSADSRGRRYPAVEHPYRTAYQRDRDKIIYTPAFRRLQYKTQVFVNFEGDHYRTRLTHTIEASQIARTIARALRLNEDLVEAIVLAHDLGHAPFGHASEEALDDLMRQVPVRKLLAGSADPGGFEHNLQSLRIVDHLEGHNPGHPGLNLTWEVREGLAKHRFAGDHPELAEFRGTPQISLEAQVADLADEIAYDCHDVDDGLRAGLVTLDQLADNPLWQAALSHLPDPVSECPGHPEAPQSGLIDANDRRYQAVKTLIDQLVTDVIATSQANLQASGVQSVEEVRQCQRPLIDFSTEIRPQAASLKTFLYTHVYYHYQVVRMKEKARRLIAEIFHAYLEQPHQLPPPVQARVADGDPPLPRAICDYLAGMTDRYAVEEHRKLFAIDVRLLP
jgi:dGTPase